MSGENRTGTVGNLVDRAMDAVGGAIGAVTAATATSADVFVKNAAIGDRYEIESARIALGRSSSAEVRSAAAKMIVDHAANTHHLLSALEMNETRGVAPPPQGFDTRREKMLKHLAEAPDDKFDTTYLSQQVMAHEETVTLMREYAQGGDNPQLRSLAISALPVVERHLDHMKMLAGSAGAT
jgi:putative membrane protein